MRRLERWGKTSLASVSMGQEVSVTTLQLAQAAFGDRQRRHAGEAAAGAEEGRSDSATGALPVRVLKPENAITMRQMMEGVVLYGTGTKARLDGYSSGGKTGTAQIYDFAAKHYTHTYNGSYMGFAPLTNPGVVVVVTLNGTRGEGGMGAYVAGPTFKVVASEALRVFDVPKDLPEAPPKGTLVAQNTREELDDLAVGDLGGDGPNILEEADEDAPTQQAMFGPPVAPLRHPRRCRRGRRCRTSAA